MQVRNRRVKILKWNIFLKEMGIDLNFQIEPFEIHNGGFKFLIGTFQNIKSSFWHFECEMNVLICFFQWRVRKISGCESSLLKKGRSNQCQFPNLLMLKRKSSISIRTVHSHIHKRWLNIWWWYLHEEIYLHPMEFEIVAWDVKNELFFKNWEIFI